MKHVYALLVFAQQGLRPWNLGQTFSFRKMLYIFHHPTLFNINSRVVLPLHSTIFTMSQLRPELIYIYPLFLAFSRALVLHQKPFWSRNSIFDSIPLWLTCSFRMSNQRTPGEQWIRKHHADYQGPQKSKLLNKQTNVEQPIFGKIWPYFKSIFFGWN